MWTRFNSLIVEPLSSCYILKVKAAKTLVSPNQTTRHTPEYCSYEGELLYLVMSSMYLLRAFSSFITIRQCVHSRGCKAFVCNVGVWRENVANRAKKTNVRWNGFLMAHWESSLMVTYREQGRVETSCCLQQTEVSTIQINHQPDATIFQFIILTFIYSSTCFGRFTSYHQELNDCSGSLWFYLRIVVIVVLCSWSGRPAGPTTNIARLSPR